MTSMFTTIVNMSITASFVAVAVMACRLLIRGLPKVYSYLLWSAVLLRLVCPFSFQSAFSFLGLLRSYSGSTVSMEYVPSKLGQMASPSVNLGLQTLNQTVNASLPPATRMASASPLQIGLAIASLVWIAGLALLLIYGVVSYWRLSARVATATLVSDRLFTTDRIATPFVLGLFKPRIYVPIGTSPEEQAFILAHEETHIRRRDHLIKPLAYFVLILHWFNPIMWLSFAMMTRDMEMSCDESVIERMGREAKRGYSNSLLSLSVQRRGLLLSSPLAFSEGSLKSRIMNILNYRRPVFWIAALAMVAVAALIVGLTANPIGARPLEDHTYSGYQVEKLIDNKTPYVGNHSMVGTLISATPLPKGIMRDTMELQTEAPPYGLTVNLVMKDASDIKVEGAISGQTFYRNSVILFSLIDNLDIINYQLADETGDHNDASYVFTFTRAAVEQTLGEDVRRYAASAETLGTLIDRLASLPPGPTVQRPTGAPLPDFSPEEVAMARAVVEEYYRATAAKDDAAIVATFHPHRGTLDDVRSGHLKLYGTEKRTLLTIHYNPQDDMRRTYRPGGQEIAPENIIVFKVNFNIEYPLKDGGPWNEGVYANWNMILTRDGKNSPWLIYDQGY